MRVERGVAEAAALFKLLSNESRLRLIQLISESPCTVGELAERTTMSQPLVSQHLRSLRQGGLVTAERHGKEVTYAIADTHVSHVVADAVTHALEGLPRRFLRSGERGALDQGAPDRGGPNLRRPTPLGE